MEINNMYWINRTACDVLKEMRDTTEHLNINTLDRYKDVMPFLIEEAQAMYNKMEAGLHNKNDLASMVDEHSEKRKQIKALKKEISELKREKKGLKGEKIRDEGVRSTLEDLGINVDLEERLDEEDE